MLNLIVVVDREWKGEIANRLERVGRYHASRTILCAVEEGRDTLDATAVMAYDEPSSGIGVIHEQVEIDIGPEHLASLDTIVDPVLVSEMPTVLWSPHGHEEAVAVLSKMTDVFLLDSDDMADPRPALTRAGEKRESAYVVDLAWLRTTPWRERLAASFDPADRLPLPLGARPDRGAAPARARRPARCCSPGGWPRACTGSPARSNRPAATLARRGPPRRRRGATRARPRRPGRPRAGRRHRGVPVRVLALARPRAAAGFSARERHADGDERVWQVLGASRGEGGILGEGVRQALLRDPTYGPALDARWSCVPR